MLPPAWVSALLLLLCPSGAAADTFEFVGNGFCLSSPSVTAAWPASKPFRVKSWMCGCPQHGGCPQPSAPGPPPCFVSSGGLECAEVCEATAGCTGFMVQDNGRQAGLGATNVCQIVSEAMPTGTPGAWGYPGWSNVDVAWEADDGGNDASPALTIVGFD